MYIHELRAENIKRIKAARVTPQGKTVVVGGDNGQGKTSLMDSIVYALAGGRAVCDKPVREGADHAEVVLDLGEISVSRTWNAEGKSKLEVKNRDGAKFPSPQAMLDKLIGKLSFDPLAFMRFDARKQVEMMKELAELDFGALDDERAACYDNRTGVNARVKSLQAQCEATPVPEDAPEERVNLNDLQERMERATSQAAHRRDLENQVTYANERIGETRREISRLESALAVEQKKVETAEAELAGLDKIECLDTLREEAAALEDQNSKYDQAQRAGEIGVQLRAAKDEAAALSKRIEEIDAEKATAISTARFPVEGVGFGDKGLTYNGQPFDQASSAEQLRVSVAMGIAMNPKLRVMFIRDGSLLDDKSLAAVAELAEKHDAQVWIERVGHGKEVTVYIEDGEVVPETVTAG